MTIALDTKDKILWADIFAQLSEFFKEPSMEFAGDVASGRLHGFFVESLAASGIDQSLLMGLLLTGDVYSRLSEEYRRLFSGPLPPYIVPAESAYKRWTNDPGCPLPLAGEKGYLMGDPAIDMIKRYRANGIQIPDKYASMPDHIALELEYMSFLCNNDYEEEQEVFVHNHLDWIDDLKDDISNVCESGFYRTAVNLTSAFVNYLSRQ